jgi:hypothetical protein
MLYRGTETKNFSSVAGSTAKMTDGKSTLIRQPFCQAEVFDWT